MSNIFYLATQQARENCIDQIRYAPEDYRVEIKKRTRSLDQNAKLHALIGSIAKTVPWAGSYRSVDTWKRLLTAAWLRTQNEHVEILPAIDGHGVDIVFTPTSSLDTAKMADLIEFVQAWAAEKAVA